MSEQEKTPKKKEPEEKKAPEKKKKKKRNLRDESLKKDLASDDIGNVLDSGKGETAEQAAKRYRQKDGQ